MKTYLSLLWLGCGLSSLCSCVSSLVLTGDTEGRCLMWGDEAFRATTLRRDRCGSLETTVSSRSESGWKARPPNACPFCAVLPLPDSLSCCNAAKRMFTQSQASEVNCSELSISRIVIDSSLGSQRGVCDLSVQGHSSELGMRTFHPILGFFSFNNLYCISFSDSKYNIQHLKILIAIMIIK